MVVGGLPKRLQAAYAERAARGDAAGFGECPEVGQPWFGADVARYLEVARDTVETYRKRALRNARAGSPKPGDLPAPDGVPEGGRGLWWWPATIVSWAAEQRPGQGAGGGRPRSDSAGRRG